MHAFSLRPVRLVGFAVVMLGSAVPALAQCSEWFASAGVRGAGRAPGTSMSGEVLALSHWDPDGAGPVPSRVIVGGDFTVAGSVLVDHVATYDPATAEWASLGGGANGIVRAAIALPNGDLLVAGDFTQVGGVTASRVARWGGTNWMPMGLGLSSAVRSLAVTPAGEIFAGGDFGFARWNGTSWVQVGTTPTGSVFALLAMPNGDVVVGGFIGVAGGQSIARWNGSTWSTFGVGPTGYVNALALAANGDVLVGGRFIQAGGQPAFHVARWDGAAWSPFAQGVGGPTATQLWDVRAVLELSNGDVVVGGLFTLASGVEARRVARWDGTAWHAFGAGVGSYDAESVRAMLQLPSGDLVVGGNLISAGGNQVDNLGRWDGFAWRALSEGFDGSVTALAEAPAGAVVAGGDFRWTPGGAANRVARFDGATWSALGAGVDGAVSDVAVLPNGDVVAAGSFLMAGGVAANRIAVWNGVTWSPLGSGCDATVSRLLVLGNGDLLASGSFTTAGGVAVDRVARWDGLAWSPLGPMTSLVLTSIVGLAELPNGDIAVAGRTAVNASDVYVLRWDGAAWSPVGSSFGAPYLSVVRALVVLPDGDLVVGGDLLRPPGSLSVTGALRWNGSAWVELGASTGAKINALSVLASGHLLASGQFSSVVLPAGSRVAIWDGSAWSGLGGTAAFALTRVGTTGFAIGGAFLTVDGVVSKNFARLETNCPALAVSNAAGCPSSGGTNTLTAASLPWVETAFRATGTGLPTTSVVLAVTGIGSIPAGLAPLTAVLPQGQPGCFVLATPDILQPLLITNGTAQSELFLPRSAALTGVTFYHQMIPIEVDAAGAFVAITATNSLRLTAGDF